jgi:phosphonate transport system substrate-binding protein
MKKTGYGPLLLVLLLTPWVATAAPSSAQKSFSFGVVPQQNPTALAKTWAPVLSYLSQKTGYKLEFQTAKDITTFNQRLKAGAFDIAYMNPFLYAVDKSRLYKVFAKEKDTRLRGIIIVAKNSPYTSLASLRNTSLTQMLLPPRCCHLRIWKRQASRSH